MTVRQFHDLVIARLKWQRKRLAVYRVDQWSNGKAAGLDQAIGTIAATYREATGETPRPNRGGPNCAPGL